MSRYQEVKTDLIPNNLQMLHIQRKENEIMLLFKSKQDTEPSKLASAIAHNIANSDIEISCLGPQAVNAAIKGLIIAKKYTQNEPFTLVFDFFSLEEADTDGNILNVVKVNVSKKDKE